MGHIYAKAADSIYETFFFQIQRIYIFLQSSSLRQKKEDNWWILNWFRFFFHFCDQNNTGVYIIPAFRSRCPPSDEVSGDAACIYFNKKGSPALNQGSSAALIWNIMM